MNAGGLLELPVIPFEKMTDTYSIEKFLTFLALGYTNNNLRRQDIFKSSKIQRILMCKLYSSLKLNGLNKIFNWGKTVLFLKINVIHPNVTLQDNVIVWSHNTLSHHDYNEQEFLHRLSLMSL